MPNPSPAPNPKLMALILDGMPAWVRGVLFSLLAIPLMFSMTGILLQINVGNLVDRYIDHSFAAAKQQNTLVAQQTTVLKAVQQRLTDLEQRLNQLDELSQTVATLNQYTAWFEQLPQLTQRLDALEHQTTTIGHWVCTKTYTGPALPICAAWKK